MTDRKEEIIKSFTDRGYKFLYQTFKKGSLKESKTVEKNGKIRYYISNKNLINIHEVYAFEK